MTNPLRRALRLTMVGLCVFVSQPIFAVELQHQTLWWKGAQVEVVRADRADYHLELLLPKDRALQSLDRFYRDAPDAVAILNAGFFFRDGRPSGFLKSGRWRGMSTKVRGVLGFDDAVGQQHIVFDRLYSSHGAVYSMFRGDDWWYQSNFIIGGAPLLLASGQAMSFESEDMLPSFIHNRYARSATCLTQSDQLLFILVRGGDQYSARLGWPSGLSLGDLQSFLLSLECVDALNLDGGYSSGMILNGRWVGGHWLQNVVARRVASALAIVPNQLSSSV